MNTNPATPKNQPDTTTGTPQRSDAKGDTPPMKIPEQQQAGATPANQADAQADPPMQGEGNYAAARRYDQAATDFASSGQVDEAARQAAPRDAQEREELARAEAEGRDHAKR